MKYIELFDLTHGDLLDTFRNEPEALESLRSSVEELGLDSVYGLSLAWVENDVRTLIAENDDLVRLVTPVKAAWNARQQFVTFHQTVTAAGRENAGRLTITGSASPFMQPGAVLTYNLVRRSKSNVRQPTVATGIRQEEGVANRIH